MAKSADREVNYWIICTALAIVLLSGISWWFLDDVLLAWSQQTKETYYLLGNTVTLLCGLVVLLGASVFLADLWLHYTRQYVPLKVWEWWLRKTKWISRTPKKPRELRQLLLNIHRLALREGYTNTGLETILTPGQFPNQVKIPSTFLSREIPQLIRKCFASPQVYLQTHQTILTRSSTYVGTKHLQLCLLVLAVRGGYSPTQKEFEVLWLFVLSLLPGSRFVPRNLTESDNLLIVSLWTDILPTRYSQTIADFSGRSTLELLNSFYTLITEDII